LKARQTASPGPAPARCALDRCLQVHSDFAEGNANTLIF
jgi:hypothetical protein